MPEQMNLDGNIEVYPGPRGFSVTGATGDGKNVTFLTNDPDRPRLNPVAMPTPKQGNPGVKGDPGAGTFRIDDTVGVRVFVWELYAAHEVMVYGDTGVRTITGGTVRRTGNVVETTVTDLTTLPAGFRPARTEATGPVFTTADPWPTELPGTKTTDPVLPHGLEGYSAATAAGYPGTPEQWLNDRYRVLPDPSRVPAGQVLTRTDTGLSYAPLPQIGAGPWKNITLDGQNWKVVSHLGNRAQSRINGGTVEFYGFLTRTGPAAEAGMWADTGVRVGVLSPDTAPAFNMDLPIVTYSGRDGDAARPVMARLHVSDKGVMQLLAFSDNGKENSLVIKPGITQFGITGLTYPARTQ
ncbi:hypothetical protein OH783_01440 [Kocuria rhizophila]|uniref:hypothetical protein n=1 Tax=Kocuria rhizophila TaxID=72000 RepID=UPI0038688176|nr:hypothetical protein OH783_01440 [Kocuria rhizophila]WSZ54100.1 hypothetical protein OG926_01445 [Kocuria rhizophila]